MTDLLDRLKTALADRYQIERELGSGGMATVYLAHDIRHERNVAVKVLRPELAAALGPDRFLREIRIAANLTHPHILPLHDSGEADGFLYYVMPHIEGESLRDKLAHEGELPITEAVRVLRDVVDALAHAHEQGVVHRDIKPDNVLLSGRHALVTDFGVAKAVSEATGRDKLTTAGIALGTPAYMAPEQATADEHIDHRADIYAVGALAYELLAGRPPFLGTTPQMVLSAHVTDHAEPVTKYRDAVPVALDHLVMKCLEKKAADRWQSAEELLPQLEALATPSGGLTPTGTMPVGAAKQSRKTAIIASALAVMLAVILAIVLIPRGSGVTLDPERVVTAILHNETGDPQLDAVAKQAAHFITQALQQSGIVQVVLWETARQSSLYVKNEADAGRVRDPPRALAEETGAGVVISGAIYSEGEGIQIQVDVTDAVGDSLLGSPDPVSGPRASSSEIIGRLSQQVLGFLAVRFDERLSTAANVSSEPTNIDAYEAFDRGVELYIRQEHPREASPHFYRAYQLDSMWATPLLYAAINHWGLNEYAQMDSALGVVERLDETLTEYHRAWLEHLRAIVDGDNERAYVAIRRAAEMAPQSKAVFNYGRHAASTNRPREALTALRTLDPERGPMRGWDSYWWSLTDALHSLGEHEEALETARRSCELYPDHGYLCLYLPSLALAALGRVEEASEMFDGLVAWSVPEAGYVAECLLGNGHTDAARQLLDRAIDWLEGRPDEEKSTEDHQLYYGLALFHYGRVEEARTVFDSLVEDYADSRFGARNRGLRGFFAAMGGDSAQARRDADWLAALDRPYLRGEHTYWRGVIAGALGERKDAVRLLRQAFSEGRYQDPAWYSEFSPLRDYAPFQELMRPKG